MIGEISHTLRKFIVGTLRLLLTVWVISLLLTGSAYVLVTNVFGSYGTQLVGGAPIDVSVGILTLGITLKLHWPIRSTDEETKDRNGRVSLALKKSIVATLRFLIPVWIISVLLRVSAGVIMGNDFTVTGIPWIGGIPLDAIIGSTALVLTVKLLWPIWPTDEEMKSLKSLFSSSGSSTRSAGQTSSQQTGWKDPVDPDDPMEGMHMGGETELAAHETWETVEQSPYNDPDDAPGGLDTADDENFF